MFVFLLLLVKLLNVEQCLKFIKNENENRVLISDGLWQST